MKASELVTKLGLKLIGEDRDITCLCPIDEPKNGGLSFAKKASVVTEEALSTLSGLIVTDETAKDLTSFKGSLIISQQPHYSLIDLIPLFFPKETSSPFIHPTAVIDPSSETSNITAGAYVVIGKRCKFGTNVIIHPQVVIYDDVTIGSNVTIHSGTIIREGTQIGNNLSIQPGAIIGSDGFGYLPDPKVGIRSVPQVGTVVLKDGVDVGANSCIDRAALGTTLIGRSTKIDNLVQIGHNVKIGEFSLICGQAGIAGSSTLGNQVILGGQAGIADHLNIAEKSRIAAHSGVVTNIKESGDYAGYPAIPASRWKRIHVAVQKLISR